MSSVKFRLLSRFALARCELAHKMAGMVATGEEKHFGHWLRAQVERLGIKKQTAASKIGVAAVTLRAWFNQPAPGMAAHNRVQVAKLLGMQVEEIDRRLGDAEKTYARQGDFERGMNTATALKEKGSKGRQTDFEDRSIEPYSEQALLAEVPMFDLSVAAGSWTDVSDVEGVMLTEDQIRQGLFRVRLAGDSMKPAYQSGDVVEFRCLRISHEGPLEGKDYYVQKNDGTATFKRLADISEDAYTLVAVNVRKYKAPMVVSKQEVVRMARAVAKVTILE